MILREIGTFVLAGGSQTGALVVLATVAVVAAMARRVISWAFVLARAVMAAVASASAVLAASLVFALITLTG